MKRLRTTEQERSRFALVNGDLVINRVNSLEYLGKSAIVNGICEATVFESNMMKFAVNADVMLPEVCIALLQTADIKQQVLSKAKNAVNQSSINQSDVRSLILPLPPLDRQLTFLKTVRAIATVRREAYLAKQTLSGLFISLQSRAFSGQL